MVDDEADDTTTDCNIRGNNCAGPVEVACCQRRPNDDARCWEGLGMLVEVVGVAVVELEVANSSLSSRFNGTWAVDNDAFGGGDKDGECARKQCWGLEGSNFKELFFIVEVDNEDVDDVEEVNHSF